MTKRVYGIDSHCHLDYLERKGMVIEEVLSRARLEGIEKLVTISTSMLGLDKLMEIVSGDADVYRSVGVHPCFVGEEGVVSVEDLLEASLGLKVVAIGETGLDYYRSRDFVSEQKESFKNHIVVARERGLPLVIHSRSSNDDMLAMMLAAKVEGDFSAIWHCFEGDDEQARKAIDLGLYISFSGLLTYKNKDVIRQIASWVPWDRILVETDAPYLLPDPLKGLMNEPCHIVHTEAMLASARGVEREVVRGHLCRNFETIFGLL